MIVATADLVQEAVEMPARLQKVEKAAAIHDVSKVSQTGPGLHTRAAEPLSVRVRCIRYEAENINAYEVVDPEGHDLPEFTPGSHIDLLLVDGRIRQYSLCGSTDARKSYTFAVQREGDGRGGSKAIFEDVRPGHILKISRPRNLFPLSTSATHHLLLAGGIGITPILSMTRFLDGANASFELHYCTRSPTKTAFMDDLEPFIRAGRVHIHHDGGDPSQGPNFEHLLHGKHSGTHLYCCGPDGFMASVMRASSHWESSTVHFEHFVPPSPGLLASKVQAFSDLAERVEGSFQVVLARSGVTVDVASDKSIIEALREQGVAVHTSCEAGLCGACRTRYLEGEPEHRDYILNEEERSKDVLICCARAKSQRLVLDL